MRVVTLMFDTLRRDVLPQYGGGLEMPNFRRLETESITFDNFYAGSLPCMPARREMLTGHTNFLYRGWTPIEPFDICFTEILKEQGIYSHLITDHQHYWEDGGATYHNRYNSYEFVRGQEGDLYKGIVDVGEEVLNSEDYLARKLPLSKNMYIHDVINRSYVTNEEEHSQAQCINLGLEFLEKNKLSDDWYLQIECFDPHEPFFVPDCYKDMVDPQLKFEKFDWPSYASTRSIENPSDINVGFKNYQALLLMIDDYLGKVLDFFDENDMWKDTVLMLNTDHGFLFGEKEWSGKSSMPVYEELAHTPFLLHLPDSNLNGQRTDVIAQTYDIAATMYDLFEVDNAPETYGKSLLKLMDDDDRKYGVTGYFAGHVNIFDKEFTYMRGAVQPDNMPLHEYTLMPMRMRRLFEINEFTNAELVKGLGYFKKWDVLKVDSKEMFYSPFASGNLLFNRKTDPNQLNPLQDFEREAYYIDLMKEFFALVDAPKSQYKRLGLDLDTNVERDNHVRKEIFADLCKGVPEEILDRDMKATIVNLTLFNKMDVLFEALDHDCKTTKEVRQYVETKYPENIMLELLIQ